ncbi:MAG: DUF4082 domain-containing protein [Gemmataceae bacterium]|nr:DUF4082 domain-containing protein [Gemmataceae bacterium]
MTSKLATRILRAMFVGRRRGLRNRLALVRLEGRITPTVYLPAPIVNVPPSFSKSSWPSGEFDDFSLGNAVTTTNSVPAGAPVVIDYTRSGRANETLAIAGDRMTTGQGADAEFLVYSQNNNYAMTELASANILRLDGGRAAVTLPENVPGNALAVVWPRNRDGAGRPILINRTDAWWAAPSRATAGGTVSIFGRSLTYGTHEPSHAEYQSWVWLDYPDHLTGKWLTATEDKSNPYKISVDLPSDLPVTKAGESYGLWVHNGHGGKYGWSEPVSVEIASAWPSSSGSQKISSTSANDGVSDVAEIATALNKADGIANVTGVFSVQSVVFPAGEFTLDDTLRLVNTDENNRAVKHIRFVGTLDNKGNVATTLKLTGSLRDFMITGGSTQDPLVDVSFENINFDTNESLGRVDAKTSEIIPGPATALFLRGTDITFRNVNIKSNRPDGDNLSYNAKGFNPSTLPYTPFDIEGQRISIFGGEIQASAPGFIPNSSQVRVEGTSFVGSDNAGAMLLLWSCREVSVTDCVAQSLNHKNHVTGDSPSGNVAGRFVVTQNYSGTNENIYIADNTTIEFAVQPRMIAQEKNPSVPDPVPVPVDNHETNAGEQILFENDGDLFYGHPIGATYNTVTLAGLSTNMSAMRLTAVITDGRGLGQQRDIIDITIVGSGANVRAVVSVSPPWSVIPDASSHIGLSRGTRNAVVYRNTLQGKSDFDTFYNASNGIQISGAMRNVDVVGNDITNCTEGITVGSTQGNWDPVAKHDTYDKRPQVAAGYFTVVEMNTIDHAVSGIKLSTTNWHKNDIGATVSQGSAIFGNVVRRNTVDHIAPESYSGPNRPSGGIMLDPDAAYFYTKAHVLGRSVDLAIVERNEGESVQRAMAVAGIDEGNNSTVFNAIIKDNKFKASSTGNPVGIEFATDKYAPGTRAAIFDNDWTGFGAATYKGSQAVSAVAPRRVIVLESGTTQASMIIHNAGKQAEQFDPQVEYASWLTVGSAYVGAEHSESVSLTVDPSGLPAGTYSATVSINYGDYVEKTTVFYTKEGDHAPYSGSPPAILDGIATTIQAEDFDTGGAGVAFAGTDDDLNNFQYPGDLYRADGVDIGSDTAGQYYVTHTVPDERINYIVNVTGEWLLRFEIRARGHGTASRIFLNVDGQTLNAWDIPANNAYWQTLDFIHEMAPGVATLQLEFRDGVADVDWFRISTAAVSLPYSTDGTAPVVSFWGATQIRPERYDVGGPGVAYYDKSTGNTSSSYRGDEDVDLVASGADFKVALAADEWVNYTFDVADGGYYEVQLAVADVSGIGDIQFAINGANSTAVAVNSATKTAATAYTLLAGRHVLTIKALDCDLNLSGIRMTPIDAHLTLTYGSMPKSTDETVYSYFAVNATGTVSQLGYYRHASDTHDRTLRLYRVGSESSALGQLTFPGGAGAGWHYLEFSTPINVTPGAYVVKMQDTQMGVYTFVGIMSIPPQSPSLIGYITGFHAKLDEYGNLVIAQNSFGYYGVDLYFTPIYP